MDELETWQKALSEMNPTTFQRLCLELVIAMGFKNAAVCGGPGDKGKDITGDLIRSEPDGITIKSEHWFFQAKRYGSGIGIKDISTDISQAPGQGADCYAIMSNASLTADAREFIHTESGRLRLKIKDYTGENFLRILFRNPRIAEAYITLKVPERFNEQNQKLQVADITANRGIERTITVDVFNSESLKQLEETLDGIKVDLNIRALIYAAIGNLLAGARRFERALIYIKKSLDITPNNTPTLLDEAHILVNLNKIDSARMIYNKILKNEPQNKFALLGLGVTLERKGLDSEALKHFEQVISIDPDFIFARNNRARTLGKMGKYKEALEAANETLAMRPNDISAYRVKSDILLEIHADDMAYNVAVEALKLGETPDLLNHIGYILERNEKTNEAKPYFEKSAKIDPNFALAITNQAVCFDKVFIKTKNESDFLQAETLLEIALKLTPKDTNAHRTKAYLYLHRGKLQDSLEEAKAADKFANDKRSKIQALCVLATVYYALGRKVDALRKIKEAMIIDPLSELPWIRRLLISRNLKDEQKIKECEKNLQRIEQHFLDIQEKVKHLF